MTFRNQLLIMSSLVTVLLRIGQYTSQKAVLTADDFAAIRIYPNPTGNFLTIAGSDKIINVQILSIAGEKLLETTNASSIDLSGLPTGTYLMRLKLYNGKEKTTRVVKYN